MWDRNKIYLRGRGHCFLNYATAEERADTKLEICQSELPGPIIWEGKTSWRKTALKQKLKTVEVGDEDCFKWKQLKLVEVGEKNGVFGIIEVEHRTSDPFARGHRSVSEESRGRGWPDGDDVRNMDRPNTLWYFLFVIDFNYFTIK